MSAPSPPSPPTAPNTIGWAKGTAGKAFIIMMLALLPLAIGIMVSNWYSISATQKEKRSVVATTTHQNAAQLSSTLNAIQTAQSLTANVMAGRQPVGDICTRLGKLLTSITQKNGVQFTLFSARGVPQCRSENSDPSLLPSIFRSISRKPAILLLPERDGLLLVAPSRNKQTIALAFIQRKNLQSITNDEGTEEGQRVILHQGQAQIILNDSPLPESRVSAFAPVSVNPTINPTESAPSGLMLETQTSHHIAAGSQLLSLLMPLLLWLAAVLLGWLVMRWLLIKPLVALSREVANYTPGQIIHPPHHNRMASLEIVELGNSFEKLSQQVMDHEEAMQNALDRQTRLTREVHHRVKNNLQVISSLISLHWRAASDPNAAAAYLSIQRRVDALAVVQRNHYAGVDDQHGIHARPMMNEIASGLKISARVQSGLAIDIALDCDDITIHQDVATALAFMVAELADLVITVTPEDRFAISLLRVEGEENKARLCVTAPLFRSTPCRNNTDCCSDDSKTVALYEKVLTGLARQLRTPLGHDTERGEYYVVISTTG